MNLFGVENMLKRTLTMGSHDWLVELSDSNMLEIRYVVKQEEAGPEWRSWEDREPIGTGVSLSQTYDDDVLPEGLASITVIHRLLGMVVGMINTHRIPFFYFNPSTGRKKRFYEQILPHFLEALDGNWHAQEVDGEWFYLTRDSLS
jgi:hypothetical protein